MELYFDRKSANPTYTPLGISKLYWLGTDREYPLPYHNAGELPEGHTAESYAPIAARSLCDVINQACGTDFQPLENYTPTLEEKYQERAEIAPKIMAAWAAYNDRKVFSKEWPVEEFATFMAEISPVVILLNSLAFGATKAAIMGFRHPLADEKAKADYIKIMEEAGNG